MDKRTDERIRFLNTYLTVTQMPEEKRIKLLLETPIQSYTLPPKTLLKDCANKSLTKYAEVSIACLLFAQSGGDLEAIAA